MHYILGIKIVAPLPKDVIQHTYSGTLLCIGEGRCEGHNKVAYTYVNMYTKSCLHNFGYLPFGITLVKLVIHLIHNLQSIMVFRWQSCWFPTAVLSMHVTRRTGDLSIMRHIKAMKIWFACCWIMELMLMLKIRR